MAFLHFCFCILLLLSSSTIAYSRFETDDAQEVDHEERLNSESYNDAQSYKFTRAFDIAWRRSKLGFRISAGSLNVNKFLYTEQLKLQGIFPGRGVIAYSSERNEDFLQQSRLQEVRLSGEGPGDSYFGILGDGGHFKKYGDIGGVIGFGRLDLGHIEAVYWSVDHYYNEKEDTSDRYEKKPWTATLRGQTHPQSPFYVSWNFEHDAPLSWDRRTLDERYTRFSQKGSFYLEAPVSATASCGVELLAERKNEGVESANLSKWVDMQRRNASIDLPCFLGLTSNGDYQYVAGVKGVYRSAQYSYLINAAKEDVSERSPESSSRREFMPYLLHEHTFGTTAAHHLQWGPLWSYTEITENEHTAFANEVKLQASYGFEFAAGTGFYLNTNWDLDNIWVDYPYHERTFRPWDGGNIQLQAAF